MGDIFLSVVSNLLVVIISKDLNICLLIKRMGDYKKCQKKRPEKNCKYSEPIKYY